MPESSKGFAPAPCGDVFVVPLLGGDASAMTQKDALCSPVFLSGGKAILAVRSGEIVSIKQPNRVDHFEINGVGFADVFKLVGLSSVDASELLLLRGKREPPEVAVLSLETGQIVPMAYDDKDAESLKLANSLATWERDYGTVLLTPERSPDSGHYDIYSIIDHKRRNLSRCHEADCTQPSLSPDGNTVVFIRSPSKQ
jgi:hypothetical protein